MQTGFTLVFAIADDLAQSGLDSCTLNNALNVAQLVVLVGLLRWVRQQPPSNEN